jgi:hypothetical protein
MLRRCARVIALAVMLVGLPTAQAADQVLTLACQGTATTKFGPDDSPTREPISVGIVVNFTARTVKGFLGAWEEDVPVKIIVANEATIQFGGSSGPTPEATTLSGSIDRVTGEAWASATMAGRASMTYALKCRPAQRMF